MPVTIKRILLEFNATPDLRGQPLTLAYGDTGEVVGTALPDLVTGDGSIPLPFGFLLQAAAAGHGAGQGTTSLPGSNAGGAGGSGGGSGGLSQEQHLSGAAAGQGAGAAAPSRDQAIGGSAGGSAAGAATPALQLPGSQAGAGGGQAGGSGTLSQNVRLGGAAGGGATAGPSVAAQALPVAGAGGGQASGTATASVEAPPSVEAYTNRLGPDTLAASVNITTATIAKVADDPDSPDTNWNTATSNNVSTELRLGFPTPPGALVTGAASQEFRVRVRKFSATQTGTPTARVELWENGVLVRAGPNVSITDANPGMVLSFPWDGSEVTNRANVECKVVTTCTGGTSTVRNSVDIGGVEWNCQSAVFFEPFSNGSVAAALPADVWELHQDAPGDTWTLQLKAASAGASAWGLSVSRGTGSSGVAGYARTIAAFSVPGRYVKSNPYSTTGTVPRLFLEGDGGHTISVVGGDYDDGTNIYPTAFVFEGSTQLATLSWSAPGNVSAGLEVRVVDATHVRVFTLGGVECDQGAITVPSLGSMLHIGVGVWAPGTGTYSESFSSVEIGKV